MMRRSTTALILAPPGGRGGHFAPSAVDRQARQRGVRRSSRAANIGHLSYEARLELSAGAASGCLTASSIGKVDMIARVGSSESASLTFTTPIIALERATLVAVGDSTARPRHHGSQDPRPLQRLAGPWRGGPDPDLGEVAPRRTEAQLVVEAWRGGLQVALIWVRPRSERPDNHHPSHRADLVRRARLPIPRSAVLERTAAAQESPAPFVGAEVAIPACRRPFRRYRPCSARSPSLASGEPALGAIEHGATPPDTSIGVTAGRARPRDRRGATALRPPPPPAPAACPDFGD